MFTISRVSDNRFFDLPDSVEVSMEYNSPFFSEQGSFSLPVTLPDTDTNRQLLGFAHRLDYVSAGSDIAIDTKVEVIVSFRLWQYSATLCLLSYSPAGFECTLLQNESSVWNALHDVTLKEVLKGLYYGTPGSSSRGVSRAQIAFLQSLNNRMLNPQTESVGIPVVHDDFEIFPVYTPKVTLNKPKYDPTNNVWLIEQGTITVDGKTVEGPVGYGMTVFLHLTFVLKKIFEYVGRTLRIEYPSETFAGQTMEDVFSHIVILNQTIDAVVPGAIYYDTLVPDVSVPDFLQSLFAMFGAAIFEPSQKEVTLRFLHTSLSAAPVLLPDAVDFASIQYAEPTQLQVDMQHVRLDADNAVETMQDLLKNYTTVNGQIPCIDTLTFNYYDYLDQLLPDQETYTEGQLLRDRSTGLILVADHTDGGPGFDPGYYAWPVCYDQLSLKPDEGVASRNLSNVLSDTHIASRNPKGDETFDNNLWAPVMPGVKNETTTITQTVTTEDGSTVEDLTQNDTCPLVLCYFSRVRMYNHPTVAALTWITSGSPQWLLNPSTVSKAETQQLDLNASGIMATMHRQYRQLLKEGMHTLTLNVRMTPQQIAEFDFAQPVLYNTRKYLPLRLRTRLSDHDLVEAELQLVAV